MAAPITHIVLANKVFDKYFSGKDRKEFFVGTSFPDIRYYDNLDREKTHQDGKSIEEIAKEDSFFAGAHFHSLLDERWGNFYRLLKDHPFYIEPHHVLSVSLKFLQDELLYDRFSGWTELAGFFDGVLEGEKKFGLPEKDIVRWHGFLQKYFIERPSDKTRALVLVDGGFDFDFIDQVNLFVAKMRGDEKIVQAARDFYDKFDGLI
ncbi:MAG: hypothetical protein PHT44_03180 [Candidatus Portnoybacteria bacterium]|nr:hypothetical protein [Candidatus Portnoybacteria bacterium]MDD4982543.1 hypothetical protein [Candidatus Portnoybacteria bacterium]